MKPMNVMRRLNESDNRTEIEVFAEELNKLIQADGLDTMRNGDLLYVTTETENGTASMNVQFYEGGNNYADYEVNYIGLGGDTVEDITVSPLAKSGWEQENGDPGGTQFEDGHECWAEACPLSNTSPKEVAEIIKASFDAVGNKNESSLNEDTEETDPVLDKTIKVYDINALIDKEINPDSDTQYRAFDFDGGAAIIVKSDGSGIIADYEGVGYSFDSTSEERPIYICPKDGDDGNGHKTISIVATASFKATIDELMQAPSKEMKVKDFFYKWNYNDRCARNFENIKPYLTECDKTLKEDNYHYITYANNPEEIGAEYEYNSMANTEVIEMLNELKRYFTQAEKDAKEIIANANHDPGVYQKDVDMCKFCAEKTQEMIDKMNSTWE